MGRNSARPIGIIAIVVALVVGGVFLAPKLFGPRAPQGPPITIEIAKVSPALQDRQDAQLVLSGLELPVTLNVETEGEMVKIRSEAFGEALETEIYRVTGKEIEMTSAIGETYDPPVLLLQSEMNEGDTWQWEGKISSGAAPYEARAELNVSLDKLNIPGVDDNAVYVRMNLFIDGVGPKPAKRELGFWFVNGKGLLKREFGGASSRMPQSPDTGEVEGL
ncbi:MAG: hypothetical protein KF784_03145 [Fimbriimonadaceae bacterium]|nr:hypothetical protein [Fimbriimonadaceae bacterium]